MRSVIACFAVLFIAAGAQAQVSLQTRYGIEVDRDVYRQNSPEDALTSIIKAIQDKKIDYLLAQLADPAFVDDRVQQVYKGEFSGLVKETTATMIDQPDLLAKLRHFHKDGKWEKSETAASIKVKDSRDQLFFRMVDGRWFLKNQKRPE